MTELLMIFRGVVMGAAEIVPSIGGSTLALVMGIYDDFIEFLNQISDFIKGVFKFVLRRQTLKELKIDFKNINLKFGVLSFLGIAIALALFSQIITRLLDEHAVYAYSFFFGLVAASTSVPWGEMKKHGLRELSVTILTFILFFIMLGIKPTVVENPSFIFLFIAAAVAISAIVLPGISISFVFLLFGVYDFVITLLRDFLRFSVNFEKLVDVAAIGFGVLFGFLIFVKLIKKGLKKYPSETMGLSVGLMLASLRVLWPFFNDENIEAKLLPWEIPTEQLFVSLFLIVLAVVAVFVLRRISDSSNLKDLN